MGGQGKAARLKKWARMTKRTGIVFGCLVKKSSEGVLIPLKINVGVLLMGEAASLTPKNSIIVDEAKKGENTNLGAIAKKMSSLRRQGSIATGCKKCGAVIGYRLTAASNSTAVFNNSANGDLYKIPAFAVISRRGYGSCGDEKKVTNKVIMKG